MSAKRRNGRWRAIGRLIVVMGAAALLFGSTGLVGTTTWPLHRLDFTPTPTEAVPGLPVEDVTPAGTLELADLDRFALLTLLLMVLGALVGLVSLAGLLTRDGLAARRRRAIQAMLGARPGLIYREALQPWWRPGLWGIAGGAVVAAVAWAVLSFTRPPGLELASWMVSGGLAAALAVVLTIAGIVRVSLRGLSRPGPVLVSAASGSEANEPRGRRFARVMLVTAQLAVAVALITASGLLRADTARTLDANTPSFVARVEAHGDTAGDAVSRATAFEAARVGFGEDGLVAESLATPGAWVGRGPEGMALNECGRCFTGGMPHPIHAAPVRRHVVMPGFFDSRDVALVEGRVIEPSDQVERDPVVVITQAYANAHFQDGSAVGKRLVLGGVRGTWHEVVGVVEDRDREGLGAAGSPYEVYFSVLQHPPEALELVASLPVMSGDPGGAGDDLGPEAQLSEADLLAQLSAAVPPGLVVSGVRQASTELRRLRDPPVWLGWMSLAAGLLAGLLAVLALMSVIRSHVASRRGELAVRAALGASPRLVRRLILGEVGRIAVVGLAVGTWLAAVAVGLLGPADSQVFSLSWTGGLGILFGAAALAAGLPGALRAASAEPRDALGSA